MLSALALFAALSVNTIAADAPVALWPNGAPDAKGTAAADKPTLTPVLPPAAKATGGAVVIVPAGSGADADVMPLARWLNDKGLAAFVVTPRGAPYERTAALADIARAVQTVRANAATYKVSAKRVALLGFGSGADLAADAGYNSVVEANASATDAAAKFSSRPDLLALIWGSTQNLPAVAEGAPKHPTTFLLGSTNAGDNLTGTIDLWNKLRAARVSVDAHFFLKADLKSVLAADNVSVGSWPELFHNWARFCGLMTDDQRWPVKGLVHLDGRTLPHGYVIFTPIDFVGAGPIIGRVLNSTANKEMGLFEIPVDQGPVAGRYKVEVYQTMNRWISNSFTSGLTNATIGGRGGRGGRGGPGAAGAPGTTPAAPAAPVAPPAPPVVNQNAIYFGHHRELRPSIGDLTKYTKARPSDKDDYVVEFKPGADANMNLKIEVFSK